MGQGHRRVLLEVRATLRVPILHGVGEALERLAVAPRLMRDSLAPIIAAAARLPIFFSGSEDDASDADDAVHGQEIFAYSMRSDSQTLTCIVNRDDNY